MTSRTPHDRPETDPVDPARPARRRLWPFALGAIGLLLGLTAAVWTLFTAPPVTTDGVVIVTTPTGATVQFDGALLGPAPVKLDGVRVGIHRVRIAKDGFVAIDEDVTVDVDRDGPLQFALKPVAPQGSVARTPHEQIEEFRRLGEAAYDRGLFVEPYLGSALYFADAILAIDATDREAVALRLGIRERPHPSRRKALERREYSRAKSLFQQLLLAFPDDPDGLAGLEAARDPARRPGQRSTRP